MLHLYVNIKGCSMGKVDIVPVGFDGVLGWLILHGVSFKAVKSVNDANVVVVDSLNKLPTKIGREVLCLFFREDISFVSLPEGVTRVRNLGRESLFDLIYRHYQQIGGGLA